MAMPNEIRCLVLRIKAVYPHKQILFGLTHYIPQLQNIIKTPLLWYQGEVFSGYSN
jgi:hypothetical protein